VIAFEKWEGLGNDFIVVDASALTPEVGPDVVRRLCDRRFGIGADGILIVDGERRSMVVRNADGSRPEMCGNGIRCVAGFLLGADRASTLAIVTDSGELRCEVERKGEDAFVAEIAMGRARLEGELRAVVEGRERLFERWNMGNPHAVTFAPHEEAEIDAVGPKVETIVAGGTNVEFVRETERELAVRVWERGVGFTLACGTGACAVAAAACHNGRRPYGEWIDVRLPGGALGVRVEANTLEVRMRGPARRVFRGTTELP
jgi:diaminopimelate epimerase